MPSLSDFTSSSARPLPVILLTDVSGSMAPDGKIDALNRAVREMIDTFRGEDDLRAEIHLGVIAFGDTAREHLALCPAKKVTWTDMAARGGTPLGAAFDLAAALVEDRQKVSSRSYRPTLVLLSDGQPTDSWQASLDRLNRSERAAKADRMALAIGADADAEVLKAFVAAKGRVFRADEARQIHTFLRFVTMSVTGRSRSAAPNDAVATPSIDLDAIE